MMAPITDSSDKSLAIDSRSLGNLKMSVKDNSPESIKSAAKQFEALFMNMMLKSMRQAGGQNGPFDSEQTRTFTSMLDQQLTQNMSNRGIGLADALVKQLTNNAMNQALGNSDESSSVSSNLRGINSYKDTLKLEPQSVSTTKSAISTPNHVKEFQEKLEAHAEEASRATGIPAKFMLGQAALETGWGKREIIGRDGSSSHNLFGIKATADWKGKVTQAVTTEYVNGKPQTRVENFRAYDSYADSFKDYAQLITGNKRYEKVLASAGDASSFAQGLQKAGYATDPNYAAKLTKIIKHSLVG